MKTVDLYLAFKPVLEPLPEASLRTENVKLVHAACFPHHGLSGYDFSANLTSHIQSLNEETDLNNINYFPRAEGG